MIYNYVIPPTACTFKPNYEILIKALQMELLHELQMLWCYSFLPVADRKAAIGCHQNLEARDRGTFARRKYQ